VSVPVGVAVTPFESRADVILRLAQRAEDLGLDRVHVAEGWTHDSFVLLTEMAMLTSRIGLGAGIISAWSRTPATIALAAGGLQRCSDGRFWLGLGASTPPLAEGLHGIRWERPIEHLRATLTSVRALLAGQRRPTPAAGARPLRLGVVPDVPVPIGLAALAPASIRLAGKLADDWVPFLWARSRIEEGQTLLREGEQRAEQATPTRLSIAVPVALGPDEARARALAARWLGTYTTRMGPLYPRLLSERFGMGAQVQAMIDAAAMGREPELPASVEPLAREVTLFGTYDEAGDAVAAWFAAGADGLSLCLPPGCAEEEMSEIVEVVARSLNSAVVADGDDSSRPPRA
jgi:alkanesulfonate monooxygenase SsuD/methylene tetrahydromethanopterin reductase-like flavin-dependent oxidoreductase (luciferase family)